MQKRHKIKNIFSGVSAGVIIFLALWGAVDIFIFSKKINIDDINYSKTIDSLYNIYSFPVPQELIFVDEKVPLENYDVKESIDYEILKTSYWQSEMFLYLKRANRYFPVIEKILKKNNVPDDFKYLAIAESGLRNVTSPAGAKGFWQFMEKTAESYNLEINDEVDERYNLEKSTQAACKYFKEMYKKYNNWALVAASYNMGIGNLDSQIKTQKQNNYWDLLLNEETGRYVYRIIAIKIIMEQPSKYGFRFRHKDLYPAIPVEEIKIDSSVSNFTNFADNFDLSYKILKQFNPWLRKSFLTNSKKKTYTILIPEKGFRTRNYYKDNIKADSLVNYIPTKE